MASYRFSQGKLLYKRYQACHGVIALRGIIIMAGMVFFVLVLFAEPDLSIGSVATHGTSRGKLDSC